MNGTLPMVERSVRIPALVPRSTPFWRRREWQHWLDWYLTVTPENRRIAWVKNDRSEPDGPTLTRLPSITALIPDMSVGGLQLRTWRRYESGCRLRVKVWDETREQQTWIAVRVLHVAANNGDDEWLHSCVFLDEN